MMKVITLLLIGAAGLLLNSSLCSAIVIEPQSCFYTPMSTMVVNDRDYILSSNAYEWVNWGEGLQSYETLAFLKFDPNQLPLNPIKRAWLKLGSNTKGKMGDSTRSLFVSVHPTSVDVTKMLTREISPRDFYVYNDYILPAEDGLSVYKKGVCYWDITDIVNGWIIYNRTNGADGFANYGLAVTGRNDPGADDPDDNERIGFWSANVLEDDNPMPHSAAPALMLSSDKDFWGYPWLPDWKNKEKYSCQFWTLSAAEGKIPQPLPPQGFCENVFGEPNLVWQEETVIGGEEIINPFLTWHPVVDYAPGESQPDWADGVYGGVYRGIEYTQYDLTANIPVSPEWQTLRIFVQYDWYAGGNVAVNINGAEDITPSQFADYKISDCGNGWYRSSRVFETVAGSPSIQVVFTVSGYEPYIDSAAVATAAVPAPLRVNRMRHQKDIDLNGVIDTVEFADFAKRWRKGNANVEELFELADFWLAASPYRWHH